MELKAWGLKKLQTGRDWSNVMRKQSSHMLAFNRNTAALATWVRIPGEAHTGPDSWEFFQENETEAAQFNELHNGYSFFPRKGSRWEVKLVIHVFINRIRWTHEMCDMHVTQFSSHKLSYQFRPKTAFCQKLITTKPLVYIRGCWSLGKLGYLQGPHMEQ